MTINLSAIREVFSARVFWGILLLSSIFWWSYLLLVPAFQFLANGKAFGTMTSAGAFLILAATAVIVWMHVALVVAIWRKGGL